MKAEKNITLICYGCGQQLAIAAFAGAAIVVKQCENCIETAVENAWIEDQYDRNLED